MRTKNVLQKLRLVTPKLFDGFESVLDWTTSYKKFRDSSQRFRTIQNAFKLYLSVTEGTATIKTDSSANAMKENAMMNAMKENAMEMHGADRIVLKRYVNVFKTDKLTGCYGQWTSSFWLVQSHSFTQDIIIKRSVLVAMVTLLNESYYHVTSLAQSHSFTQYISTR